MKTAPTPSGARPLVELGSWLADLVRRFRARRRYLDVLDIEVAQEIAGEVGMAQASVIAIAHAAEVNDLEAHRLLLLAQEPASDGGRTITPAEAAPITRCILRSAEADHRIGESLS